VAADVSALLGSVLPVLLLLGLGMALRGGPLLNDDLVSGLKRIIVDLALPALLFTTFLTTRFAVEHLWVILTVVAVCLLLLGLGEVFRRLTGGSAYQRLLFTGFELGMLGFALFTAVYGAAKLPALGVLALGHELFIWFVFASLLRIEASDAVSLRATTRSLVTSPVIIAILAGLILNFAGLGGWLTSSAIPAAFLGALGYLSALIVPLVLLIVGFGTRLSGAGLRQALPLVATRLVVVVGLALALNTWVIHGLLGLDQSYQAALFTLMVMPPPFIVPLFIPTARRSDAEYCNNVLSLYSLASVAVFVSYVLLTGGAA
jgi:malate permease and related proteins